MDRAFTRQVQSEWLAAEKADFSRVPGTSTWRRFCSCYVQLLTWLQSPLLLYWVMISSCHLFFLLESPFWWTAGFRTGDRNVEAVARVGLSNGSPPRDPFLPVSVEDFFCLEFPNSLFSDQ